MKKVIITKLELRNFRGIKELEIKFNEGVETSISGENSTGKSTIFNAYCWLLFGKDAKDRKDFNIRPLVDGQLLRRVDCEVSGTFIIDDEETKLRRMYKEKWVKPRGEIDEVFKGNETECFWNDVPVSNGDYQKRINDIINDSVFKMVSIHNYFPTLDWKLQREQLFQLAGTITDHEIASKKPEFASLLDRISGKSFADFKREIAARKKRLKDDLAQVQPRIDQTQRLMPANVDFAALEAGIIDIEGKLEDIDKAITDKSEAMRQQYDAAEKKQSEINELKQRQQKVLFDARSQAREDAFRANEKRHNLEYNIKSAQKDVESYHHSIQMMDRELDDAKTRLADMQKAVSELRQSWFDENAKEYSGDETCHTCGQGLPENMKADARSLYADAKVKKLAQITVNGGVYNVQIAKIERTIADMEKSRVTVVNEALGKESTLAALKDELAITPPADELAINPDDLPEYKTLGDAISRLESVVREMNMGEPTDTAELRANKTVLQNDLRGLQNQLTNRDLIAKYTQEIKSLEVHGKDLAQQIADVEREEYTMQQFTKAKIDECERRINGLFNHVTFRLFEYTIDGNESETCIPLVGGIPYDVANTAGQVNAGLDIINALVKFHGVSAPIFIDGRESVNRIISTESQIINLVVSHDKSLTIK